MTPTLAFTAPPATADIRKPKLSSSYSLLLVMVVYVLFGAAGFFAAARMI